MRQGERYVIMQAARNTIRLSNTPRGIRAGAALLASGGLVAFPTETVYGLGADARQDAAVKDIYVAKGRPGFNPLITHVSDIDAVQKLAILPPEAEKLAKAFWPGPLTLVLPQRDNSGIADRVTAGNSSIAMRIPDHPLAQALLREFNGPIAAPSANPSGRVSPTTADHVLEGLFGRIDAVIDAGPCDVGLESTIVGFSGEVPTMLRPGGITAEQIEQVLQRPLAAPNDTTITAPGQLASHYAPDVHLITDASGADGLWLAFGPLAGRAGLSLSETANLQEAATNLFDYLRQIDAMARETGESVVMIDPIPRSGLGSAINDRLKRAAAPR